MIKFHTFFNSFTFKWIFTAFIIRALLFIFFAINFKENWPSEWIINHIFIVSGDTSGYYNPIESFVNGNGYDSFCRMPGLLPIYAPLYILFGEVWGKTLVIIAQFLTSVIAVYVLSKTALLLFKKIEFFYAVFFIYSFSSFACIWDHYGYSDSFAISLLIFSLYFFVKFINSKQYKYVIFSGLFIAWSIFFRPVHCIVIPILLLSIIIQNPKKIVWWVKSCFLFLLSFLFLISIWSTYIYSKYKKVVILQGSLSDCYEQFSEEYIAIRNLVISWGGDYQHWNQNSEAAWFFGSKKNYKKENPFNKKIYTNDYNIDSLISIKEKYDAIKTKQISDELKSHYKTYIISACEKYRTSYKQEHFFDYYIANPLKLIRLFAFPGRLDNLPFPKLSEMSWYHKIIKGGYIVSLNLIMILGVIGIFLSFSKNNIYGLIPLAFIVGLAGVLGFIEQRYLTPAYPFMCLYASYSLIWTYNKLKKKKQTFPAE